MKRFLIIVGIVILCVSTSLLFKETWIFGINTYQRHISPHKGYHCAYSAWNNDISCSAYGKKAIIENGVIAGLFLLNKRFDFCSISAKLIRASAEEDCYKECCEAKKKPKPKEECCCSKCNKSCEDFFGGIMGWISETLDNLICSPCGCDDGGGFNPGTWFPPGTN